MILTASPVVYNTVEKLQFIKVGAILVFMVIAIFAAIKATVGLRVSPEDEDAGLDIATHGMYGYPEQFIPAPEIGAASTGPRDARGVGSPAADAPAPATMKTEEVPA